MIVTRLSMALLALPTWGRSAGKCLTSCWHKGDEHERT